MINANVGVGSAQFNNEYSDEYSLVFKLAKSSILGVKSTNPLAVFDKGIVENGTVIEQAVIKLAESYAYDKNSVDVFAQKHPELAVRYFKDYTEKQYETTVNFNELRKVIMAGQSVERVAENIVANLTESDGYEDYVNSKQVLTYASTEQDGEVPMVKVGNDIAITDAKAILKAIKNTVKGMTFVNSDYNKSGIKRSTPKDRIVIVMPYKIKNALDVDELAGVFNLSKAELEERIIEIDEGNNIYILDKEAILKYTRLYLMTDQWNAKSLYMNYFLTVHRMYAFSQLFDSAFITVTGV